MIAARRICDETVIDGLADRGPYFRDGLAGVPGIRLRRSPQMPSQEGDYSLILWVR